MKLTISDYLIIIATTVFFIVVFTTLNDRGYMNSVLVMVAAFLGAVSGHLNSLGRRLRALERNDAQPQGSGAEQGAVGNEGHRGAD